jgi:hypothetical protein
MCVLGESTMTSCKYGSNARTGALRGRSVQGSFSEKEHMGLRENGVVSIP